MGHQHLPHQRPKLRLLLLSITVSLSLEQLTCRNVHEGMGEDELWGNR